MTSAPSTPKPLLVELLTEELPPKALARLGRCFADAIVKSLGEHRLLADQPNQRWFATPRRLAVLIDGVLDEAREHLVREKLLPTRLAFNADGSPSPALSKKLASKNLSPEAVNDCTSEGSGETATLYYQAMARGAVLSAHLPAIVQAAIKGLPVPKMMRWGNSDVQFVRPLHGLVMLHGATVVPGSVLDQTSGRVTRGHRFLSAGDISLASADEYPSALAQQFVIVDYQARRDQISAKLASSAAKLGASLVAPDYLIDEVTALVEWPEVYVGSFDAVFLQVPQACLMLTMQQNQKYFPLLDAAGNLLNRFLIVSNMRVDDPTAIVAGNERVVRPRLADARFFFEQDRKTRLADRLGKLDAVVFHNQLGSVGARVKRLVATTTLIADSLQLSHDQRADCERAAWLAKADLVTEMVGEFPELQGNMGRTYALADGESALVAEAIAEHYAPRFAGDVLPSSIVGQVVALADKLEALAAFFVIGKAPSGDKDPFALRRAALGVLRILTERQLPLPLVDTLAEVIKAVPVDADRQAVQASLYGFMLDRLRGLLKDQGFQTGVVEAVLARQPKRLDDLLDRCQALAAFADMPEAAALAAADKRSGNLLRKLSAIERDEIAHATVDSRLLTAGAEQTLATTLEQLQPLVATAVDNRAFTEAMQLIAGCRQAVDAFFAEVMVMADDPALRRNRLCLLLRLSRLCNAVAHISHLAAA